APGGARGRAHRDTGLRLCGAGDPRGSSNGDGATGPRRRCEPDSGETPLDAGPRGGKMKRDVPRAETRAARLFLAPALTLLVVFFFLQIAAAFLLSFTDFDIYAIADPHNVRVIGARNYARLASNPVFWLALRNTFYFVLVGGPLTVTVSLAAAMLVN